MDLLSYCYTRPSNNLLSDQHIVYKDDAIYLLTLAHSSGTARSELRRPLTDVNIRNGAEPK